MNKRVILIAAVAVIVLGGVTLPRVIKYVERQRIIAEQNNIVLPPPELPVSSSSSSPVIASSASASSVASVPTSVPTQSVRAAVNWDVPFTSQAPLANWNELHQEACEEASVLMVMRYFQGKPIGSPEQANTDIEKLVADNEALGFPVDDTAAEIIVLLRDQDPSLTATLLKNPTEDSLKKVLSEGKLVIVPAAGQQLGNPYFTAPGPRYHMLMLRGYTDSGYVITNDPGTKRGEGYVYRWDVLLNAIHDWNGGEVESGEKVVVVVSGRNE